MASKRLWGVNIVFRLEVELKITLNKEVNDEIYIFNCRQFAKNFEPLMFEHHVIDKTEIKFSYKVWIDASSSFSCGKSTGEISRWKF